ncbi:MAG: SOS response-associated peptidase [Halodesulfurarchaeum sp.]|nr:SOS response-associated peptidase [Halodesulfurarchaeum sp.]
MCGRTSLFTPQPDIERRFNAEFDHDYEPRYNIAPGDTLAVVHNEAPETITADTWGFVPEWAESVDDGPRPSNARAETVAENELFRSAFENRRALVIADGYYEWARNRGGKQPYRIARTDGDPFAMAGLWSHWKDNGETLRTVTIITTEPNDTVASIHDRMPVILEPGSESQWLDGNVGFDPSDLLQPYPDPDLEPRQISTLVNDPTNDSPAIIDPVGGSNGQTGLEDFGAD